VVSSSTKQRDDATILDQLTDVRTILHNKESHANVIFEKLIVFQLGKNFPPFMETVCSLPRSQKPAMDPIPSESSPHGHITLETHFHITLPSNPRSPLRSFLFIHLLQFYTKFLMSALPATCTTHPLVDLITVVISGKQVQIKGYFIM
jgi:hypothetical protein